MPEPSTVLLMAQTESIASSARLGDSYDVLSLLSTLLLAADDRAEAAEATAEAIERMTGCSPVAVALPPPPPPPGGAGWTVAGRENGAPLTLSRQRALAAALESQATAPGVLRVRPVPGESGAVLLLGAHLQPGDAHALDLALSALGANLDRIGLAARAGASSRALARLSEKHRRMRAAHDLLLGSIDHLLDGFASEVPKLLARHLGGEVLLGEGGNDRALAEHQLRVRAAGREAVLQCPSSPDPDDVPTLRRVAAATVFLRPQHDQGASASALLALALLGSPEGSARGLSRCAARVGIDLEAPLRAALVTDDLGEGHPDPLAGQLRDLLANDGGPRMLITVLGDDVVVVGADEAPGPALERWQRVQRSLARFGGAHVAVGSAGLWPEGLGRSLRQARWIAALQGEGSPLSPVPDVAVFESAGLISEVVGATHGQELLAFARGVLAPLIDADRCGGELVETLYAYLVTGGSTSRAAEILHLHPSSVKYRLKVIRQLIGEERLHDADARFELQLSLRLVMASRRLGHALPAPVRSSP